MHLLNATGNNRIALIYHLQITDQSVYENLLITEIATHKLVSTTIALQFVVTTQTEFNTWGFDATVSIHAPAKGATTSTPVPNLRFAVSIHAPAKGATSGARVDRA